MAISINARGTESGASHTTPTDYAALITVAAGANIALVVTLAFAVKVSAVSVTWDQGGTNQAMTSIGTANATSATGHVEIWGLVAPTTGAKTLRVAWTGGATDVATYAVAWNGANQSGGSTTFPGFVSAALTNAAPSVTVTSATGDGAMDVLSNLSANPSAPTQRSNYIDTGMGSENAAGSDNNATGSSPWTFGWTLSGSDTWVQAGCAIKAAGAATDTQEWRGSYPPARNRHTPNIMY